MTVTEEPGLYSKFLVRRLDQSPRHAGCDYYVLDLSHDPHAAAAVAAYAASCAAEKPDLAADLRRAIAAARSCREGEQSAREETRDAVVTTRPTAVGESRS